MNYKKVKEQNLDYFSRLLNESEDPHHVVAQSEISHIKRFQKLLELGDFNGKRILDVGCGIGGFYDFLLEKGITCDFTGIDINPKMIEVARKNHPSLKERFFVYDILEENLEQEFHFAIANGPLNLKFPDQMNLSMTMKMIQQMYRISSIGIAFTMTSSLTRKPNNETFYYRPGEILEEAAKFCNNVKVDHTYLPHDFTLFCYKKDLYDF